jgi:hypothetical protein
VIRYIDGTTPDNLGYIQNRIGTQYWWEFDSEHYLPFDTDDYFQFTGTAAVGTAMYRATDSVL